MRSTDHKKKVILKVEELSKVYKGQTVLKSISFEVYEGETVVIIGPSGTGKSTLLRCINFLTHPDGGRIYFDGKNTLEPDVNEDELRQHIGMVFQDFLLFNHLTALGNIEIGLTKVVGLPPKEARERALRELVRVGLADRAGHYPGQLSGGQKQRVAIARSLALEPRIMLFDEPTSALDPELIGEVLEVMRNLAMEGMTMLVVTHEMGFAREVADNIIFMEEGVVVEQGSPQQMFYSPKILRTRSFLWKISDLYGKHESGNEPV